MLNLQSATDATWLASVEMHLDELLIDHAHCEKKAAGAAMNLVFAYVERVDLVTALSDIVAEELQHFRLVLDLLAARGVTFRRLKPGLYGSRLAELVRQQEPQRAVDRLLVAGLIEARSCERFGLLRDGLADRELAAFYGGLFESEARHHATYVRLARQFASAEEVDRRLQDLAAEEAAIVALGDGPPRMHS